MNFRDAYKSMADEICPDKELLSKVLESDFPKKKHFVPPMKSVYTLALAAMFVITATAVYFKSGITKYLPAGEKITGHQNSETRIYPISGSGESGEGDVSGEIRTKKDAFESDSSDVSVFDEEKAVNDASVKYRSIDAGDSVSLLPDDRESLASPLKETAENETFEKSDNTQATEALTDSGSKDSSENSYDAAQIIQESEISSSTGSGGSGGGASSGGGEILTQSVSISKYWQYIGFDVSSRISLPHNMTFYIPQSATIKRQGDEVIQDILSISAASPDGEYSLFMTISKITEQTGTVSVMVDGVYIGICSDTLREEEISKIISSIR